MNDIEKTFQHLLVGLDDKELQHLSSAMYREMETRIQTKVMSGYYPVPVSEEMGVWQSGEKLKAIKAYQSRTKTDANVREVRLVFENESKRAIFSSAIRPLPITS